MRGSIDFSVPDNFIGNPLDGFFKVSLFQLALPNDYDAPPFRLQLSPDLLIPFLVPGDFGPPELGVGFGDRIIFTVLVAMPKAAVNKDNCPILWQHDIRFPGKTFIIHPVTKPLAP